MLTADQRVRLKAAAYARARKLGIPIPLGVHVYTRKNGHIVGIPFVGEPMRELIRRLQRHAGLKVTGEFDEATRHYLGYSPPPLTHVYGVDVSNHQPRIDYAAVKGSGVVFAWAKASEGTTYTDPYYQQHRSGFGRANVIVGAYHFARPTASSGDAQAKRFLQVAQPRKGDLLPVLDLEVADGASAAQIAGFVRSFGAVVQAACGACVLYTYPAFWTGVLGNTSQFATMPLWIANYGVPHPAIPGAWNTYAAWQFTSTGAVPGIPGHADRSVTGISIDQLRIK